MYFKKIMRKCDRCGKGVQVGMNVSHSHIRTKKRWLPNLHTISVKRDSEKRRMKLCTKCLRIVKKQIKPAEANKKILAKQSVGQEAALPV